MLKLRFTNNKQNAVWLVEPKVTIGRKSTCDLVINHSEIQLNHAEIRANHEQLHFLLLVDSDTTLVNGKPAPKGKLLPLKAMDLIRLADVELQVIDPKLESRAVPTVPRQTESTGWALKANHSALANRLFALKDETVVGRSNECDITLAAAHLSRRHAQLIVKDGLLYVKDLGSSNGTFVNGKQVEQARIKRGDDLRFDTLSFGVIGPSDDLDKTTMRSVSQKGARSTLAKSSATAGVSAMNEEVLGKGQSSEAKPAARRPRPVSAPVVDSRVETISSTPQSPGRGGLIGAALLLVIAGGGYFVWQSGLM